MCYGFSGWYDIATGKVYFTSPDRHGNSSHASISRGMKDQYDVDIDKGGFLAFEITRWTVRSFRWDDIFNVTLSQNSIAKAKKSIIAKFKEVAPVWEDNNKKISEYSHGVSHKKMVINSEWDKLTSNMKELNSKKLRFLSRRNRKLEKLTRKEGVDIRKIVASMSKQLSKIDGYVETPLEDLV